MRTYTCYVLKVSKLFNKEVADPSKILEVNINGTIYKYLWDYELRNYHGWIIDGDEPDVKIPAEDTWDGWFPIFNEIYFGCQRLPFQTISGIIGGEIRMIPFDSLEELENYVNNEFLKIIEDLSFKW